LGVVLSPRDLLAVRETGSVRAANADREKGRLSRLFPRRKGRSPRIDEPELRVAGESPTWAVVGKLLPSPTSRRILTPVLTLMPGMDVRIFEGGWASSGSSILVARSLRWSRTAWSEPAKLGTVSV